jgi:hypothetical protein
MFSRKHFARNFLLICVALLLVLPVAAYFLSGETEVTIGNDGGAVWAEVHGTRLDVPAEALSPGLAGRLKLPAASQLGVGDPSSSQYWQPAQPDISSAIGVVGEWLQMVRPPAQWTSTQDDPDGTGTYRLKAGRALETIPLDDGTGNGFVLQLRPERAAMAWWTLANGQPGQQLAGSSYRPAGVVSIGDMLAEIALVAWAATVLCVIALLAGLALAWVQDRRGAKDERRTQPILDPSLSAVTAAPRASDFRPLSFVLRRFHPRPAFVALAFFLGGTVLASVICLAVLDGIPHVQDEVSYLFQGKIFALLHFWVPEPPAPEFFQSGFIQRLDGRWFSKYPPGYPLLLIPTLWAGMPWLTNALSCGASLALIYLAGLRMFGLHTATWAGLLGLVSPWVLFMSGSYMSHPTTMLWAALFLYALVGMKLAPDRKTMEAGRTSPVHRLSSIVYRLSPVRWPASAWALLAGFAIGMAFITREWTALGIGLGAAVWAVWDILSSGERLRKLFTYALVVVGFLPPLFFLLYENYSLTGNWLRLAQDLVGSYDTPGFGPGHGSVAGHTPALGIYNGLVYLRTLATVFNGWPAPFALAPIFLGLFAWVGGRRTKGPEPAKEGRTATASPSSIPSALAWDALLWLCLAGLIAAYFLWWSATTIYGPRYWYEGLPFMLLMAGRGMDLLGRITASVLKGAWAARARWLLPGAIFALFTVYALTQTLPAQAHFYTDYNDISAEPVQQVENAHLTNAIVFVALEQSRPDRDYGKVFFANDPLLQGDVIYARDLGKANNEYLVSRLPGRVPYYLPLDGPPKPGVGP